jgi:hypothetical protein
MMARWLAAFLIACFVPLHQFANVSFASDCLDVSALLVADLSSHSPIDTDPQTPTEPEPEEGCDEFAPEFALNAQQRAQKVTFHCSSADLSIVSHPLKPHLVKLVKPPEGQSSSHRLSA